MPPNGNFDIVVPGEGAGAAAHSPGMAPPLRAGSGVTDEAVAAQLGGTDKVLSELAWPTLAEAP